MSLMQRIHQGRRHSPPRLLIYGTEGIGKSTTASQAPKPIFVPTEDGLDQIDCASFPLAKTLADVRSVLGDLLRDQHDFETVVSARLNRTTTSFSCSASPSTRSVRRP